MFRSDPEKKSSSLGMSLARAKRKSQGRKKSEIRNPNRSSVRNISDLVIRISFGPRLSAFGFLCRLPLAHLIAEPLALFLALAACGNVGLGDLRRVFIEVGGGDRAGTPGCDSGAQAGDFALALGIMDSIGHLEWIGGQIKKKLPLRSLMPNEFVGLSSSHDVTVSCFAKYDVASCRSGEQITTLHFRRRVYSCRAKNRRRQIGVADQVIGNGMGRPFSWWPNDQRHPGQWIIHVVAF